MFGLFVQSPMARWRDVRMRQEGLLLPDYETSLLLLLVVWLSGIPNRWHDLPQVEHVPAILVLCNVPYVHFPEWRSGQGT